ncbi:hypothetical protein F383_12333 [Gossypium arboreum]|uniref:Uncharacterized protein n=1 Tax=Gossypium arboreum TaxID=29729 RepID=A0A0B0Q1H3_GOSAR|nr:hypothetical protein F383_12333 [Gossypium arboreum]
MNRPCASHGSRHARVSGHMETGHTY